MKLHHQGAKIEKITADGLFGSFLFFSSSPCHYGDTVYSLEIDKSEIVEASRLFYIEDSHIICAEYIEETSLLLGVDADAAMSYLDESNTEFTTAGDSWNTQRLTALCAKALGFRGVEVTDEHGTSYMIDMLGKEAELELCD